MKSTDSSLSHLHWPEADGNAKVVWMENLFGCKYLLFPAIGNVNLHSAIIWESSWHYTLIGYIRCWRKLRKHPWVSKEMFVGENQPRKYPWVKIIRGNIRGRESAEETSGGGKHLKICSSETLGVMYCEQLVAAGCKLISGQLSGSTSSASNAWRWVWIKYWADFWVKSYLGQDWHSVPT